MGKWIDKFYFCLRMMYRLCFEIINLIYPRRCPVCDEIISRQGSFLNNPYVHKECVDKLSYIKEPFCKKCGRRLEGEEETTEYCYSCSSRKNWFVEGRAVFDYDDIVKQSIINYKFKGKKEYADFYVYEILNSLEEYIRKLNIDLIVPVPIHEKKLKSRGYNQADIVARKLGKALGIEVVSDFLVRNVNTAPQKELNSLQRAKNLKNVFCVNKKTIDKYKIGNKLNKILIIDDIYTTGATINSCTKAIKLCLNVEVYFITVAIAQGM